MLASREMVDLVSELNKACDLYYNTDTTLMSDSEYDMKYKKLENLEEKEGIQLPNSPTKRVGYEVKSKLDKVNHEIPLKSLDKINNNVDKLKEWLGEEEGFMPLKLDGLTVKLSYVDGELVQGSTRGNGKVGEDITHSVKCFKNVPMRLSEPLTIDVVGEGVIKFGSFNFINSKLGEEEQYKHPRNLVAGSIRSLDSRVVASRDVRFFAFDCITSDLGCTTQSGKLEYLNKLGFDVAIGEVVIKDNIEDAINNLKAASEKGGFPIDGLVCTFNDLEVRGSKGETSKFPKHSIAYKFADEVEETMLRDIEWSIGKTGALTPVAIFKAVELDGTSVSRASVHNVSVLWNLELGLGDRITVKKANQIIPQIVENLDRSDCIDIPKECPYCNAKTELVKDKDAVILKCTNGVLECKGQLVEMLSHYVSREGMNIVGLSTKNIEKYVEAGILKDKVDIHKILTDEAKKDVILDLGGITLKGFDKLCDSIEKASKGVKLSNFLVALGIDGVGKSLAEDLEANFKTIDKLRNVTLEDLVAMEGVSDITANKIVSYFATNSDVLDELLKYIEFKEVVAVEVGTKFKGLTFVVTGKVNKFKNRDELKAYIKNQGGKVTSSISEKTSYLVSNEASNSSKSVNAKKLGVPVITEEELLNM